MISFLKKNAFVLKLFNQLFPLIPQIVYNFYFLAQLFVWSEGYEKDDCY